VRPSGQASARLPPPPLRLELLEQDESSRLDADRQRRSHVLGSRVEYLIAAVLDYFPDQHGATV
jgi:hypothetical protein